MKFSNLIIFVITGFTLFNCQNKSEKENIVVSCNDNLIKSYDSLFVVMGDKFTPNNLNFDKSIQSNQDVDKFIYSVKQNDKCLERSNEFNTFILTLILKQYKFHLQNYHQGYDLFSMNSGNANYIIDKYLYMIGKNKNDLEMLNSGYIVEFLNNTKKIQQNESQKKLVEEINKLIARQKEELK